MLGTVASAMVRAETGADFCFAVVTCPPRFTVAFVVEANSVLRAFLVTCHIKAVFASKAFVAMTHGETKRVSAALTPTVAIGSLAQTLCAEFASPASVTGTRSIDATAMVAMLAFGFGIAVGPAPTVFADTPFLLVPVPAQRVIFAVAASVGVAVIRALLDFTFVSHPLRVAVALFVEALPVLVTIAGAGDVLALFPRITH
jgi:hypothetical protein